MLLNRYHVAPESLLEFYQVWKSLIINSVIIPSSHPAIVNDEVLQESHNLVSPLKSALHDVLLPVMTTSFIHSLSQGKQNVFQFNTVCVQPKPVTDFTVIFNFFFHPPTCKFYQFFVSHESQKFIRWL